MKTIAIIYGTVGLLSLLFEPLLFGKERKPYSAGMWVLKVIMGIPLYYLLYKVAFQQ